MYLVIYLTGCMIGVVYFFFFQAEDGIRDLTVTGVQTCALPIYGRGLDPPAPGLRAVGAQAPGPPETGLRGRERRGRRRRLRDRDEHRLHHRRRARAVRA